MAIIVIFYMDNLLNISFFYNIAHSSVGAESHHLLPFFHHICMFLYCYIFFYIELNVDGKHANGKHAIVSSVELIYMIYYHK